MTTIIINREADHYFVLLGREIPNDRIIEIAIRALAGAFSSMHGYSVELVNLFHDEQLISKFNKYAEDRGFDTTIYDLIAAKGGRRYYRSFEHREKLYERKRNFGPLEARVQIDSLDELLSMVARLFWEHCLVVFSAKIENIDHDRIVEISETEKARQFVGMGWVLTHNHHAAATYAFVSDEISIDSLVSIIKQTANEYEEKIEIEVL